MTLPWGHRLSLNWRVPLHRRGMEFLARYFTVVNLDFRGSGLSERAITGLSLETFAADIEAVLDQLGIEELGLCAMGPATLVACHFASRERGDLRDYRGHVRRVGLLVIDGRPQRRGRSFRRHPVRRAHHPGQPHLIRHPSQATCYARLLLAGPEDLRPATDEQHRRMVSRGTLEETPLDRACRFFP